MGLYFRYSTATPYLLPNKTAWPIIYMPHFFDLMYNWSIHLVHRLLTCDRYVKSWLSSSFCSRPKAGGEGRWRVRGKWRRPRERPLRRLVCNRPHTRPRVERLTLRLHVSRMPWYFTKSLSYRFTNLAFYLIKSRFYRRLGASEVIMYAAGLRGVNAYIS